MSAIDDYITGRFDPNAPFNQADIYDIWGCTIDFLPVSDDEFDVIVDDENTENELEQAYKKVLCSKFIELEKLYAKEIATEFMRIRKCRLFKDEKTK